MPDTKEYQPRLAHPTAVIANGETVSSAVDLHGMVLCGLYVPASMTGTALKFHACPTVDGTYVVVKGTDGNEVSVTVSDDHYCRLDPKDFDGIRFLKIVSGSAETGAKTITLAARPR